MSDESDGSAPCAGGLREERPSAGTGDIAQTPDFTATWLQMSDILRARCRGWMRPYDSGDEAFSRIAVKALKSYAEQSRQISDLPGWLMRLAYNECSDLRRAHARERRHAVPLEDMNDLHIPLTDGPEDDLLRDELRDIVATLVQALAPALREPLQLLMQGQSVSEIARILGATESGIRKRIQRARHQLAEPLASYSRGEPVRIPSNSTFERDAEDAAVRVALTSFVVDGVERDATVLLSYEPQRRATGRIAALEQYTAQHPAGWKKRLALARALREEGRFDEAIEHYAAVLAQQPRCIAALIDQLEVLMTSGRHADSVSMLEDAAGSDVDLPRARLRALGDALRCAPSDEPLIARDAALVAAVKLEEGHPFDALRAVNSAWSDAPNDATLLTLGHEALYEIGLVAAAHERLQLAATIDPRHLLVMQQQLATLGRGGKLDDVRVASPLVRRLRAAAAEHAESMHAIASFLVSEGRVRAALDEYREFLRRHPRHARAWSHFAELLHRCGDDDEASRAALHALEIDESDWRVALGACEALERSGRNREARQLLREILQRAGCWSACVRGADVLAWRSDDAELASEIAATLLRLQPDSFASWLVAGRLYARAERDADAARCFCEGWARLPANDGAIHGAAAAIALARFRLSRGDDAQAQRWLEEAARQTQLVHPFHRAAAAKFTRDIEAIKSRTS